MAASAPTMSSAGLNDRHVKPNSPVWELGFFWQSHRDMRWSLGVSLPGLQRPTNGTCSPAPFWDNAVVITNVVAMNIVHRRMPANVSAGVRAAKSDWV
jgi:hypothetical protein